MDYLLDPENRNLLSIICGALAVILIAALLGWRWRVANSVAGRFRRAAKDVMMNIVVPDGEDGEILFDYVLLTPRGVVVVDVRDVIGHVFGSDAMEEWTVLSDQKRFTFANPQYKLYDRMAALKRILPNVPVEGFVAFSSRGKFTKGQPSSVVMLDDFIDGLNSENDVAADAPLEEFDLQWAQLREQAVVAGTAQGARK